MKEVASLRAQLAAATARAQEFHRRAQRLEGIEAENARLRASHEREVRTVRRNGHVRIERLVRRLHNLCDLAIHFGARDTYTTTDGKVSRHRYECFLIADLAAQRDAEKARADKAEADLGALLAKMPPK